jgi:hypothetical protein
MSALTAGNWIAFQSEGQKQLTTCTQWTVALEHQFVNCHGVGANDTYMLLSGICSEADAKAMAASKELLETVEALLKKHEAYQNSIEHAAARALLHKIREDA